MVRAKTMSTDVTCSICLDALEFDSKSRKEISVLNPCGHLYHSECLMEWKRRSGSNTCPLDRRVFTDTMVLKKPNTENKVSKRGGIDVSITSNIRRQVPITASPVNDAEFTECLRTINRMRMADLLASSKLNDDVFLPSSTSTEDMKSELKNRFGKFVKKLNPLSFYSKRPDDLNDRSRQIKKHELEKRLDAYRHAIHEKEKLKLYHSRNMKKFSFESKKGAYVLNSELTIALELRGLKDARDNITKKLAKY